MLLDEAVPLFTLTGPGGVGNTRLALAIAHDVVPSFADVVVFVDLTPVASPGLVGPTMAHALGVREAATGRSPGRSFPFPDDQFDAVWCANVTHYLRDDDLRTAMAEFRRVVRPGGMVAIKDF